MRSSARRVSIPLLVGALLLAACGATQRVETGSPDPVENTTPAENAAPANAAPASDLAFGLRQCGEYRTIAADPGYYRDTPVYVANEMDDVVEEVRAWAVNQPHFEDLWIDRDHSGWVSVGFSSEAEARQADIEAEFPDDGVVAVAVEHTQVELDQLRDAVFAKAGGNYGGSANVPYGEVRIDLGVLDEESLAPFAEFAGEPVCFDGKSPEDAVIDGPQPTSGDGWRLLAVERTGESYRTGIASTPEQFADLWSLSGVASVMEAQPDVDFQTEIVVWFGAVYGSGCEIRLDDVVIGTATSNTDLGEVPVIHGEFVVPGNPVACNDDANPEAYMLAVERDRLPDGPFAIQLGPTDPPGGVPEERTLVAVSLRAPGSALDAGDIQSDQSLSEAAARGYTVGPDGVIEPGYPVYYALDAGCDFATIGPINGITWVAQRGDLDENPPASWLAALDGSVHYLQIELSVEPTQLVVSAEGSDPEIFEPASSGVENSCFSQ